MTKMKRLVTELNNASEAYYNGEPILSDKEFDNLYTELKAMEKDTGVTLTNSPTQRVGYQAVSVLKKVKHEFPALSLDDTKELSIIEEWLGDRKAVCSWKCDGCTVILTYENGRLIRAATRGDGHIGDDITHHVIHFKNVATKIRDKRHIVVRGEAVVSFENFEKLNDTLPMASRYKNPRSMVAGAIRFLDARKSAHYGVEFVPFELVNALDLGVDTVKKSFHFIQFDMSMIPVAHTVVENGSHLVQILEFGKNMVKFVPFPTDGKVVILDDINSHRTLGTTKKYPKYAKAFKWPDTVKETILRDVHWSVAKSGLISPVAIFDPVELEGTSVKRAQLHNLTMMRELGLGIGDHISVYKANMIIPKIHSCLEKTNDIQIPTECPICHQPIERRLGVNQKSEFLHCVNPKCKSKGETK